MEKLSSAYKVMEWSTRFAEPVLGWPLHGRPVTVSALRNLFEVIGAISEHLSSQVGHVAVATVIDHGVMHDEERICSKLFYYAVLVGLTLVLHHVKVHGFFQ